MTAKVKLAVATASTLAERIVAAPELASAKDARRQVQEWQSALGARGPH